MYMTEQRKRLFEFFCQHPDRIISAKELKKTLNKNGESPISISAIYRNLAKLEKDGLILRMAGRTNRETLYRFVSSSKCDNKLHMTCLYCGKTFHLEKDLSFHIQMQVWDAKDFHINLEKTTMYGLCKKCFIVTAHHD